MPDYSNSKIYKIVNTVDEEVYIGSTTQFYLSQRMTTHRDRANNLHPERLYKHMSKIGVEHFYIDLLEEYPCQTKDQLLKKNENAYLNLVHSTKKYLYEQTRNTEMTPENITDKYVKSTEKNTAKPITNALCVRSVMVLLQNQTYEDIR